MEKKIPSNKMYGVLLICAMMTPLGSHAQTTFDLTSSEPDVVPAGVTIEWHSAVPVNVSNIYATPEKAAPGLYYAVFNYGNNCYSTPSPIRVGKTSCPSPTVDLTTFADEALVPTGTQVTYHTASPASDANAYTGDATAAPPGKYFLAYRDQVNACYSNTTPVVVLNYEDDPGPVAMPDDSLDNELGTTVSVKILSNDTLSDGSIAAPVKSNISFSTTGMPAGSILNGDGSMTVAGQGTWSYDKATGAVTFQPLTSYKDNPWPATYVLMDSSTCKSSQSTVKITYKGALPVTLISFEARAEENGVLLNWRTSSEVNVSHFELQRSTDAKNFTAIANVAANNVKSSYQFVDEKALPGKSYYRLKMIDLDSTYAFSKIVNAELTGGKAISIYPNPVSKQLKIAVGGGSKMGTISKVTFYDQAGVVRCSTTSLKNDTIDVTAMADGLYVIEVGYQDGTTFYSKVLIRK